jgi:hypothetical protein
MHDNNLIVLVCVFTMVNRQSTRIREQPHAHRHPDL